MVTFLIGSVPINRYLTYIVGVLNLGRCIDVFGMMYWSSQGSPSAPRSAWVSTVQQSSSLELCLAARVLWLQGKLKQIVVLEGPEGSFPSVSPSQLRLTTVLMRTSLMFLYILMRAVVLQDRQSWNDGTWWVISLSLLQPRAFIFLIISFLILRRSDVGVLNCPLVWNHHR